MHSDVCVKCWIMSFIYSVLNICVHVCYVKTIMHLSHGAILIRKIRPILFHPRQRNIAPGKMSVSRQVFGYTLYTYKHTQMPAYINTYIHINADLMTIIPYWYLYVFHVIELILIYIIYKMFLYFNRNTSHADFLGCNYISMQLTHIIERRPSYFG